MVEKTEPHGKQIDSVTQAESNVLCHAPITIFALPKAFRGDTCRIQSNAIRSWLQLSPAVNVLLLGDEEGIADFSIEHGIAHVGSIARNQTGTPLVSDAFSIVRRVSSSPILVYCNADVILNHRFVDAMESLANQEQFEQWLGIGQRTDVLVERELDFEDIADVEWLEQQSRANGKKSSHVCKEYFAFNRNLYGEIPPFAVGRGNWDNWMVSSVKSRGVPVIDLSEQASVFHQSHDYAHIQGSRLNCYVNGEEARENQRLAGGRHLISGSVCSHRLGACGVEKIGFVRGVFDVIADMPRFIKLMIQLMRSR